ncbi:hypothetical protein BH23ACT10_BH23ACT10_14790 [soil metagenome]
MTDARLDRTSLTHALTQLGRRLRDDGLQGELFVVGGAAMALAYDDRRFTRDVDAIFEPKMRMYELASELADELGLPGDWLNDGVKAFVVHDPERGPVFEFDGLRVQVASPELLLALKVRAARLGEDDADVRTLADMLGLRTAESVLDMASSIVGERHMTPRAQFFVEEVMAG